MASKVLGWDRIGHLKPTLKKLQDYVIPRVANKWYWVGVDLCKEADVPHLDIIQGQYPNNFTQACTEMFKYWLRKYPNATWNKLIKSLRAPGLQLNTFALEIIEDVVKAPSEDDSEDDSAPAVNTASTPAENETSTPAVNILSERPDMLKLKQIVIPEVKPHWDDLAYAMEYKIPEVKAINTNGRDVGERCTKLFEDWLTTPHGCTPKTWGMLIARIRNVDDLFAAAERITKKLTSGSKLSAKDKTPVVSNTDYHSDNEIASFEEKSTRAVHETKVVNKKDDHSDYEGTPAEDKSMHVAPTNYPEKPKHQPKDNSSTKCNLWKYCTICVAILAVMGGVYYSTKSNDATASDPFKYENEAIAGESNDDDSSSQGAPSMDILNKKPEMADLNKIVVKKVMIQWEQLAQGFRYDDQVIDSIKLKYRESPEECCRAFLKNWLLTDNGIKAPKTWSTLFNIIKEYTSIAPDIREEMIAQVKKL